MARIGASPSVEPAANDVLRTGWWWIWCRACQSAPLCCSPTTWRKAVASPASMSRTSRVLLRSAATPTPPARRYLHGGGDVRQASDFLGVRVHALHGRARRAIVHTAPQHNGNGVVGAQRARSPLARLSPDVAVVVAHKRAAATAVQTHGRDRLRGNGTMRCDARQHNSGGSGAMEGTLLVTCTSSRSSAPVSAFHVLMDLPATVTKVNETGLNCAARRPTQQYAVRQRALIRHACTAAATARAGHACSPRRTAPPRPRRRPCRACASS